MTTKRLQLLTLSVAAALECEQEDPEAKGCGTCPQCQEAKAPHQVCANCGYYKGRQVKAVDEA